MPAVIDSLPWTDGTTYTLQRLMAASVEFLDDENARYTVEERVVAYTGADSVAGGSCTSVTLPYQRENGRVILVVEPGLPRLDSLQLENGRLVQMIRSESGASVRVEYARAQRGAEC